MPKLTLRDLFAIVIIVALALGWQFDHWEQQRAISALGGLYLQERARAEDYRKALQEFRQTPADQPGPSK